MTVGHILDRDGRPFVWNGLDRYHVMAGYIKDGEVYIQQINGPIKPSELAKLGFTHIVTIDFGTNGRISVMGNDHNGESRTRRLIDGTGKPGDSAIFFQAHFV